MGQRKSFIRAFIGICLAWGLLLVIPAQAQAPIQKKTNGQILGLPILKKSLKISSSPKLFALRLLEEKNIDPDQFRCLDELWNRESHWNHKADNPTSSAFGIAQMLGEKSKNPFVQIRNGIRYIFHRYDDICSALRHHDLRNWY